MNSDVISSTPMRLFASLKMYIHTNKRILHVSRDACMLMYASFSRTCSYPDAHNVAFRFSRHFFAPASPMNHAHHKHLCWSIFCHHGGAFDVGSTVELHHSPFFCTNIPNNALSCIIFSFVSFLTLLVTFKTSSIRKRAGL